MFARQAWEEGIHTRAGPGRSGRSHQQTPGTGADPWREGGHSHQQALERRGPFTPADPQEEGGVHTAGTREGGSWDRGPARGVRPLSGASL